MSRLDFSTKGCRYRAAARISQTASWALRGALRDDFQPSDSDESEQATARRRNILSHSCRIPYTCDFTTVEEGLDCNSDQWRCDPSKRRRSGNNETVVQHACWALGSKVPLDPTRSRIPHLRDNRRQRRRRRWGPTSTCKYHICCLSGYRSTRTPMHDASSSSLQAMASPLQL